MRQQKNSSSNYKLTGFRLARFAWVIAALVAWGIVVRTMPSYLSGFFPQLQVPDPDNVPVLLQLASVLASLSAALTSLVLAVILFFQKTRSLIILFVSFFLMLYGIIIAGPLDALVVTLGWRYEYVLMAQGFLFTTPTIILFSIFPSGTFIPRWTRWLIPLSLFWMLGIIMLPPLNQSLLFDNSFLQSSWFSGLLNFLWMVILIVPILYAQVYRFRKFSNYSERQQTKWVVFGFTVWGALLIMQSIPYMILSSWPEDQPYPWWGGFSGVIWWLSLTILPISLAIAILRSRLWDIDVIIRRTLLYTILTALLALAYFGGVTLLQNLFSVLSGQQSTISIVISTLVIAALFNPLRNRLQEFIDRRFYRKKYDLERAMSDFAVHAREETDLERLTVEMVRITRHTLQPEEISVWFNSQPRIKHLEHLAQGEQK